MTTKTMTNVDAEAAPAYAPYHINLRDTKRSLSILIRGRLCWQCAQRYEDEGDEGINVNELGPQNFIDDIIDHCAKQQDFLLPDTPLKEAIFRVLLQNGKDGNEPMDAEQISAVLTEKWEMTPFPRDTSPPVIQRLLDNGGYYCVTAVEGEG